MSQNEIKMQFIDEIEKDIKKFAHTFSYSFANNASKLIQAEYEYVIMKFYREYKPERERDGRFYVRHHERGFKDHGLSRTFKRYYRKPHNTIYYGGIELSIEKMYTDYSDSREDVLNAFLEGYHGHPSNGIYSSIEPYYHMTKYCDVLYNHPEQLIKTAKKDAKKESYNVLKF